MPNWLAKALQQDRGKTSQKIPTLKDDVFSENPPTNQFGTTKRRRLMGQRVLITKVIHILWHGEDGSNKMLVSKTLKELHYGYIVGFRNKYEGKNIQLENYDHRGFNSRLKRTRKIPLVLISVDPATNPFYVPLDGFKEIIDWETFRTFSNDAMKKGYIMTKKVGK